MGDSRKVASTWVAENVNKVKRPVIWELWVGLRSVFTSWDIFETFIHNHKFVFTH